MFLALPSKDLDGKFEMLVEAVKEAGTTLQDSDSYRGRLEEVEVESLYDEPRDVHVPLPRFRPRRHQIETEVSSRRHELSHNMMQLYAAVSVACLLGGGCGILRAGPEK